MLSKDLVSLSKNNTYSLYGYHKTKQKAIAILVMFHHSFSNKQISSRSFMGITGKSIDPGNCVNLSGKGLSLTKDLQKNYQMHSDRNGCFQNLRKFTERSSVRSCFNSIIGSGTLQKRDSRCLGNFPKFPEQLFC